MYCQLSGYTREELLSRHISDFEALEQPEETAQRMQHLLESGRDRFETRHRRKDGSLWDVEVSIACYPERGTGMFGFLRDISLQKATAGGAGTGGPL
jgi:PAS domain S-box-containing protein